MCAFQAKGQGFLYIPDSCTAKQLKERSTSVVITVIEGNASVQELEEAFSDYIGTNWHCTARTIGPDTYVMRFPNQRDVKKACYNDRMILKSCGVVVKIVPWSATIGAKGIMEMAWVKVANIPLERRNERNVAYVSSLVGVPLEIDMATLHKPEFVRVRLGCRNVDELPRVDEAVLGTHFFDFFYEIEKVLVRDPEREKREVQMEADVNKSPFVRTSTWGKHDPKSGHKGKNDGYGKNGGDRGDNPIDEKEGESMESEESEDNTLLIETMALEAYNKENAQASQAMLGVDDAEHNADEIQVVEIEGEDLSRSEKSEYLVQFPASPSEDVGEVIPTYPSPFI
ncbi:hypothetical protein ACQJBY_034866 [Aegilops geniculata]